MQNTSLTRIAFFLYVLTAAHQLHGAVSFTFTKIAENGTPMPGFAGNFGSYFEPTIDGDRVAFLGGHDSSNFRGVYLYTTADGALQVLADNNTLFPDSQDTFSQFGTDVAVSGDNVMFKVTRGLPTRRGVYLWEKGVLRTIVDLDDAIPDGTGNFIDLHTKLSGQERFSSGMQGFYSVSETGGAVTALVDENTLVADGSGTFASLSSLVFSNGNIAFLGSGGNQSVLFTRVEGQLRLLAGSGITLPGSTDEFSFQPESLSISGENVAFVSESRGTALPMGIYSNVGGELVKVIDENDTLNGNTPNPVRPVQAGVERFAAGVQSELPKRRPV